jgi:zinc resistance-associated protein
MIKHILTAGTTALLVLPNLSSTILADPAEVPDDAGRHRPPFSAEDFATLTDARIAALKSGLQLKPTQEKKWVALETVLREAAKTRVARATESREKVEEPHEHHDMIEGLREPAK